MTQPFDPNSSLDNLDADPGWRSSVIGAIFPYTKKSFSPKDGLVALRQLFIAFCVAIIMFGVALTFLEIDSPAGNEASRNIYIGIIVAVGILAHIVISLYRINLPLDGEKNIGDAWRTRMFIRIGISEVAALIGFAVAFIGAGYLPYFIGALFTFIGFYRAGPLRRHIASDNTKLQLDGWQGVTLTQILRMPPEKNNLFNRK